MRVPYSWLREVVSAGAPGWDVAPTDLEQTLVRIGHEVEEVVTLDRRGRTKIIMQPVKHEQPIRKTPSPYKKPSARKSLSPKAGGSKQSIPKPRLSKVCNAVSLPCL